MKRKGCTLLLFLLLGACDGPTGPEGPQGRDGIDTAAPFVERISLSVNPLAWVHDDAFATWYIELDVPAITASVVDSGFVQVVTNEAFPLPDGRQRTLLTSDATMSLTYTYAVGTLVIWGFWSEPADDIVSRRPELGRLIVTVVSPQ